MTVFDCRHERYGIRQTQLGYFASSGGRRQPAHVPCGGRMEFDRFFQEFTAQSQSHHIPIHQSGVRSLYSSFKGYHVPMPQTALLLRISSTKDITRRAITSQRINRFLRLCNMMYCDSRNTDSCFSKIHTLQYCDYNKESTISHLISAMKPPAAVLRGSPVWKYQKEHLRQKGILHRGM